jgi:hypothetical protein
MAFDTRNKRASTLGMGLASLVIFPVPGTTENDSYRAQTLALFAGTGFPSFKARLSNEVFQKIFPDMIFPDQVYDFDI